MSKYLYFILTTALFASCTFFVGHQNTATTPSPDDIKLFQKAFMSSYFAERAGIPGGVARALTPFSATTSVAKATVPVNQYGSLAFAGLTSPTTIANYPEPGQSSTFTAVPYTPGPGGEVYDVKVTTSFPAGDLRKSYFEEYYVEDVAVVGTWTTADPIVKFSGGVWSQDQSARVQMLLTFQDGSTRNETIVSSSQSGGPKFDPTAFDVNGSLDLSHAIVPATTTDSKVVYSSVVMYYVTPSTKYNYWFWSGSGAQTILGVRYYTEVLSGSTYTSYTMSFEKTVGTITTTGGSFTSTLKTVIAGSQFDTLAESVLRQQVVYKLKADGVTADLSTGQTTTNMQTRVVNIAGKKDFYLSQLNSDNVLLSSWATSTIYVPTGDADEILAGDPGAGVFTRNQQVSPGSGTLPYGIKTTDLPGLVGDLATTLYISITEGSASTTVQNAPGSNLALSGNEYSFNGQQAVGLSTQSSLSLANAGTVEAWVYINQMTNTAGIVHKGVNVDFSDECFSLQGWNASGMMAIVLDNGVGNNYDIVTSATNLNAKRWYYLAATWDKATKKICLYINGALSASGTMSVTSGGVRDNTSDIILGSQLPTIYSSADGYFGLDGRIVGANVGQTALDAATISAQYDAYKGYTRNW